MPTKKERRDHIPRHSKDNPIQGQPLGNRGYTRKTPGITFERGQSISILKRIFGRG